MTTRREREPSDVTRPSSATSTTKGQKVPLAWADTVIAIAKERFDLSLPKLAAAAGQEYINVYRLSRGEGSVKTARAVSRALEKLGASVPALVMGGAPDEKSGEWMRVGGELRELDPDEFDNALAQVKEVIAAKKTVERGISLIADPLPTGERKPKRK